MKSEQIKEFLDTRPFKPLRICMSDGVSITIGHPELVWVARDIVAIGTGLDKPTGLPDKVRFCSPEHIVRVEMISKPAARNGRAAR